MVARFKASGKLGTKITPETFADWQEAKRKKRQEEAKKKVEAELKKKKGGKGLSVLSGRDLFEYKRDLFKDRDDDDDEGTEDINLKEIGANVAAEEEEEEDNNMTSPEQDSKLPARPITIPENGTMDRDGAEGDVQKVAAKVQSDLFLEGDDDDLDDIEDDDE